MLRDARPLKLLTAHAVVLTIYFAAGKLGLALAFTHPSASAVWPPTGLALALVLLLGRPVWPAITLGAFLVNLTTAGTVWTSLGIAAGNTLEALIGARLIERYANGRDALLRTEHLFRFIGLAALACVVSAAFGTTTLLLGGLAAPEHAPAILLTWWLGDLGGALLVAPVLLAWAARDRAALERTDWGEAALVTAATVLVTLMVFGGLLPLAARDYLLPFLTVPFLLWAALRFGQRGATTASLLLAIIAVWGTLRGHGAFAIFPPAEALVQLQGFLIVVAATALMVATVVSERAEIEQRLLQLSVSDPLTGLANYRMLIDRLHAEIARSKRTQRSFVLLFMDLDGLKRINDVHGHLTGNRALLRLSWVLKDSCRSIDLPARFGGDEFVVVMPETDAAGAERMATRIGASLARSREKPPITVSTGVAVYPTDGDSPETLMQAADTRLYDGRRRVRER